MIPLRDNQATRRLTPVNSALIALNVAVFFYELTLGRDVYLLFERFALVPWAVLHPGIAGSAIYPPATLVTSLFLHGGWLHIGGNMLFLFIFGPAVEERMGSVRYPLFYLAAGIVAGLATIWMAPASHIPVIGASGAIAGVLGAYLIFFPRAKILTVWPILLFIEFIELPAIIYLFLWFAVQLGAGIASHQHGPLIGGVAWWAHVGGFLFGIALGPLTALGTPAVVRRRAS